MKHTITILLALLLATSGSSAIAAKPSSARAVKMEQKRQQEQKIGIQRALEIMKTGRFALGDPNMAKSGFERYGYVYDIMDPNYYAVRDELDTINNTYKRFFYYDSIRYQAVVLDLNSGYLRAYTWKTSKIGPRDLLVDYRFVRPYNPPARLSIARSPRRAKRSFDLLLSGIFQIRMPALSPIMYGKVSWVVDRRYPNQRPVSTECDTVAKVYTATYVTDPASGIRETLTYNYRKGSLRIDSYVNDSLEMIQLGHFHQISRAPRRR